MVGETLEGKTEKAEENASATAIEKDENERWRFPNCLRSLSMTKIINNKKCEDSF